MSCLGERPWTDVGRARGVLVAPVGATEQHGPHLPLSTDTQIAEALANALAARVANVVVAPTLAYGSSGEHQDFPGTLSVGQEAVELLLVELGRSATGTFVRVLFVSTHGGNSRPVAAAVRRLRSEGRDVRAWSPARCWRGDAHAGRIETSVMLALAPTQVRLDAAVRGETRPLPELMPALVAGGVQAVSASGVLGDPSGASGLEGRRLLDAAVDHLAATVRAWPGDGDGVWLC